jgi:hypothetical protein
MTLSRRKIYARRRLILAALAAVKTIPVSASAWRKAGTHAGVSPAALASG